MADGARDMQRYLCVSPDRDVYEFNILIDTLEFLIKFGGGNRRRCNVISENHGLTDMEQPLSLSLSLSLHGLSPLMNMLIRDALHLPRRVCVIDYG